MGAEDFLRYDFGQLVALAGDIRSNVGKFEETHTELTGYVQNLKNSWESPNARQAYDQAQLKWDTAHRDLLQVLNTIAKVVEDGAVSMKQTDDKNAMTWLG